MGLNVNTAPPPGINVENLPPPPPGIDPALWYKLLKDQQQQGEGAGGEGEGKDQHDIK
jgi:hypothetical protein